MQLWDLSVFGVVSLLGGIALALNSTPADLINNPKSAQSGTVCADSSLLQTVYQSFRADEIVHVLNYRFAFENYNTQYQTIFWGDLHPAFQLWPTQQNFTVPLFQLGTEDRTEYIYRIGVNASTPPVISGFNTDVFILGWVYNTQVCGSVPLLSAALSTFTDNYFTTNAFEHDNLVGAGWADTGVVAFVISLNRS